jgi:potassium/chloride transporter 9
MPETQVHVHDDQPRTISFADTPVIARSAAQSRHHSRQNSVRSEVPSEVEGADVRLEVNDLLHSYKYGASAEAPPTGGSGYSTQSLALSFNDLPSRAQHLILNELFKQNSGDTAVILTTLPIPTEGTCMDDIATIQYLSDIEVLCTELPPTLMILSNNMTVTVSL